MIFVMRYINAVFLSRSTTNKLTSFLLMFCFSRIFLVDVNVSVISKWNVNQISRQHGYCVTRGKKKNWKDLIGRLFFLWRRSIWQKVNNYLKYIYATCSYVYYCIFNNSSLLYISCFLKQVTNKLQSFLGKLQMNWPGQRILCHTDRKYNDICLSLLYV
jgi:hypothetical protein